MRLAMKLATFMRRAKFRPHHALAFSLAISTLSIIDVPIANAATGTCIQKTVDSANYRYVSFISERATTASTTSEFDTCTWTVPAGISKIDYMVVGGGGGGGSRHSAGGGAGGYREGTAVSVSNVSALSIQIGLGGRGGQAENSPNDLRAEGGYKGGDSKIAKSSGSGTFTELISSGGGGGNRSGSINGGSGGGVYGSGTVGVSSPTTSPAQGNSGAQGIPGTGNVWSGGGGGGAGGAGANWDSSNGGAGGPGATGFGYDLTERLGKTLLDKADLGHQIQYGLVFFAAGGGGGSTSGTAANPAIGGGGAGRVGGLVGGNALTHSGSGGGASGQGTANSGSNTTPAGGDGASGIVIIRYSPVVTYTYNGNGGTGTNPTGGSGEGGSAFTSAANPYTRSNWDFIGWNTAADGSGNYVAGNTSTTIPMLVSNMVFYAQWRYRNCEPTQSGLTISTETTYNGYCLIYIKDGTGTWTPPTGVTSIDYFMIAGGGGGGSRGGGGGGAGGFKVVEGSSAGTGITLNNSNPIAVSIGAGGVGGLVQSETHATNGGNTTFAPNGTTITVNGGGGGGSANASSDATRRGYDGGSGGGAVGAQSGNASATVGAGISGQGRAGGAALNPALNGNWPAGGGGGASSVGSSPANNANGGNGGNGVIIQLGDAPICYATGGGGGIYMGNTGGAGGNCYGVEGSTPHGNSGTSGSTTPPAPRANSGAGGGGSGYSNGSDVVGGAGAAGLVLIRYTPVLIVTYNYNGATGSNSTTSSSMPLGGTSITLPTPTKTNYTFGGWYEASDFSGSALGSTYSASRSLTVYAKWTADSKTITYAAGTGGSGSAPTTPTSAAYGSTFTTPANTYTKAGHSFAGWSDGTNTYAAAATYPSSGTVSVNVTLTATWTANNNTVVFDANTGSGSMSNQSIVSGSSTALTTNAFTKTGYTFAGWNTNADGSSGTGYTDGQSVTLSAGMTVYAKWTANSNTVVFNNNSGSGTMSNQTIVSGTATSLTSNSFTRTGYIFSGWNTNADGTSGTTYTNGQSVTITAGMTLYAKWTSVSSKLRLWYDASDINSYNGSVGTTVTDLSASAANGTVGTGITLGTNGGWVFDGTGNNPYVDAGDLTTTQFANNGITIDFDADFGTIDDGEAILDFRQSSTRPSGNFIIKRDRSTGNLRVDIYHGGTYQHSCASYSDPGIISSGMHRYTISLDGTDCNMYLDGTLFHTQSFTHLPESGTTWAQNWIGNGSWSGMNFVGSLRSLRIYDGAFPVSQISAISTFVVTYNGNSGTSAVASATTSGTVKLPTATRSNYTHNGWFTASTGGTKIGDAGASYAPTQSVTIYSQWTIITRTITYAAGDGGSGTAPTSPVSVNNGATFTVPANTFVKTGYSFNGWSDGTNTYAATATYPTTGSVGANVTLTAIWSANSCTVSTSSANGYTTQKLTGAGSCVWTTPTGVTSIEVAVVGGGGGGGFGSLGGGGGAGEVLVTGTSTSVSSTTVSGTSTISATPGAITVVTIGTGGTSGAPNGADATTANWVAQNASASFGGNGSASSFGAITALGGGGGGGGGSVATTRLNGAQGGSGGGSAMNGTGGLVGSNSTPSGWTSFKSAGADGENGGGGGAGGVGSGTNGGSGLTVLGNRVAGGGGGWGKLGSANSSTDTVLGGNGRVTTGSWPYAGSAGSYTSPGAAGTGTGGGAGAPGGSGAVIIRYAAVVDYTYNANGGTGTAPTGGSIQGGKTFTTATNPFSRTGFAFSGWYTTSTGTGGTAYSENASNTMQLSDSAIVLYAKWTATTLTVTFDSKSGTSVNSTTTSVGGTMALAPTAPTKTGYTFAGWSATDGGTVVTFPYTHGKSADFTLYAKWTTNVYTVTFVYNAATGGNSVETATVTTGLTPATLPTPTRTGYTFSSWYAESGFTNLIGAAGDTFMPTGSSLTPSVYAKWTAVNYSVTYATTNSSGGSAPTDSTNYNIGNSVVIKGNTGNLVRTGYTFTGWTAASDGSGTLLTSGSTFTVSSSNMTFYPKWSANTYTVTYNANGASGSPADATASYTSGGTAVTLSLQGTMAKTGFDWSGWSTTPTGSALSGSYTTSSDVTLYAVWTIKTITLTYDKGIASSATFTFFPTTSSGNYGTSVTLNSTLDATVTITISSQAIQHRFVGWNDGSSVYQGNTSYLLGATNKTMTANWVKVFGVRYSFNGGTPAANTSATDTECLLSDSLCNDQQDITTHAAPTKAGYNFAGWVNQNGTAVPTASTTKITSENYLFYATWTAIDYTITYSTAGGSQAPTESVKQIGGTFTLATTPTKTGYNFTGWSDGTSVFGAGATYYVGTANVTLTAQWSPKTYTVIYDWNGGSGSSTSNTSFTVGNSAVTLPVVGDHVKDGYTFAGWSETNNGSLLSGGYTPTGDITLYAIWGTGSYTTTYDAQGGTVGTTSAAVQNGSSLTLPTPSRTNFIFEGWYTASSGGSKIGNAAASHQPTQSRTMYARWTQASLYGLSPSALTRIGTTSASSSSNSTFTSSNANSSVSVTVPAGALPNGTTVNFDLVGDFTRAQSVLTGTNSYIISLVVSWLASDGTVPNTADGKPIAVTISNASIRTGMSIYSIVAGNVTLLGTATQDGTVNVNLTSDPEVVVVATKPGAPTNVAASSNATQQSVISWSAPAADGGSPITGYTVTSNTNATCATSTASCTFTGLANSTSYTFTVTATNALGTSASSASASATTAGKPGAPTSVTASAGGTQLSIISWTAPASNGGATITGYTATASSGATCTTSTTSCTITGLSDGTTYTFTVTATNSLGTSDPSSSVTARTASAVVNNGGGGGSSSSAPSTPEPNEPVAPVKNNVTVAAPITVIGDKDANVSAIEIAIPVSGSTSKPPTLTLDFVSQKFIAEVKVVEGKLVLTPESGFSGRKTVTVTIIENGIERIVQIPLTVLPEVVGNPVVTPAAATKSTIRWSESVNADSYTAYINGKKVCATSTLSCTVRTILGPKSVVEIISIGGDRTVSQKAVAEFKQSSAVLVARIVSATNTKATLSKVDTNAIDKVVTLIRNQGFTSVTISNITTTKKTDALAMARISAINKYITEKSGSKSLTFDVVPAASRTYFNNISLKG